VERKNGKPELTFRHYGTDGSIYNEDVERLSDAMK
jgi:hypothetical protein